MGPSLIAEHRLRGGGVQALLFHSVRDLPGSGLEPRSPALAGRAFIPEPPGKPMLALFTHDHVCLNLEMVRH